MRTIGIIGGLTWLSTIDYYRIINETVNKRLGGNETAKIILYSVNYGELVKLTQADRWDKVSDIICDAAQKTEAAGADCLLLAVNTMHRLADEVQRSIKIPLIHIAEVTATAIRKQGLSKVILLGTKYTMELPFYHGILSAHGIEAMVPEGEDFQMVHNTIFDELGKGLFLPETRKKYISLIEKMKTRGAQGVILGCTEIPLLIKQDDCSIPVFDTTRIHAIAGVDFALAELNETMPV